jgi:hypothetical protein
VTTAIRPSHRGEMRGRFHDFWKNEREIFSAEGLNNPISLIPLIKLDFLSKRFSGAAVRCW